MSFIDFFKKVNKKTNELNENAYNPFLKEDFEYNPFRGAFLQTYVWIEEKEEKE